MKRSGIVNDPNRADDPEYIVRLVGKVVAVSLETVEIVEGLRSRSVLRIKRRRQEFIGSFSPSGATCL